MALSESVLEQQVGDVVERRRLVSDILNEYREYPGDSWVFGPLLVWHSAKPNTLTVETPDGDLEWVDIPEVGLEAERIEEVEQEILNVWEWWLAEL